MAYLALYRKWRPQAFSEVVGQKHISIPLLRAITQDRLAHAYLFSGPRGTGKTSMAKILAKAVNCTDLRDGNPCNACANCKEINSGASLDVYEIDAASNRGIEEIRALRESVRTLPAAGRKKVYIIDEVHMLTKEAFNALLKTLEEPPSHVLFILATTEPEKIPLTILSRCQRYEFHRISVEDIKEHLLFISEKDHLGLTEEAADLIAVRADGGLRDALSLLDQCSGVSEGQELTADIVYHLLGLTGKDQIIDLYHDIRNSASGETLQLFYEILQSGREPAAVLRDLLEHFRAMMICKINPQAPELSSYGSRLADVRKDASDVTEPYLDALFGSLHESLADTKRSSQPRMSAEMGLLRLCRLKGSKELDSLAERVAELEKEIRRLTSGQPSVPQSSPAPHLNSVPIMPEPLSAPAPKPIPKAGTEKKKAESKKETPISKKMRDPGPIPAAEMGKETLIEPSTYPGILEKLLTHFLAVHRLDIQTCLKKGELIVATSSRAVIALPAPYLVLAVNGKGFQPVIRQAMQAVTGRDIPVKGVSKGSSEEAEALHLLSTLSAEGNPAPQSETQETGGFHPINQNDIPTSDKEAPALAEALKIMPGCDIYEKD